MVRDFVKELPLIGGLVDARRVDYKVAASEILSNVILSTLPIWAGAFLMSISDKYSIGYFGLLLKNMRTGEMFIYATALLGPLIFSVFKEYREDKRFPGGLAFILISAVVLVLSSLLFVLNRSEEIFGVSISINEDTFVTVSVALYIVCLFLVFISYVYRSIIEDAAPSIVRSGTARFVEEFNRMHEGED